MFTANPHNSHGGLPPGTIAATDTVTVNAVTVNAGVQNIFTDGSALDIFKRHRMLATFEFRPYCQSNGALNRIQPVEMIKCGEMVEVHSSISDIPAAVLDLLIQYTEQNDNVHGFVCHISIADSLFKSLRQSQLNLHNTPALNRYVVEDRLVSASVHNFTDLLTLIESLKVSLRGKKSLVVFENMSSVIKATQKLNMKLNEVHHEVEVFLRAVQSLHEHCDVTSMWICPEAPKFCGGLRSGYTGTSSSVVTNTTASSNSSSSSAGGHREPTIALWKSFFPRLILYSTS